MAPGSIFDLVNAQAGQDPERLAVLALDRRPLTYGRLRAHLQTTVSELNRLGLGRGDCVTMVLPNGPEMAVAFLSVASAASSAPLNPAYSASEFEFYLTDLDARALVVMAGERSPAVEVARERSIPVLELHPLLDEPAGLFALTGASRLLVSPAGPAASDDVALILHTSGTTSRPKMVPLTHANLCASAANIERSLSLTRRDRCLNLMPLFHIHGLMAALSASLAAGASLVCTPGFHSPSFFEWVAAFQPTWYTAVPAMHQSILSRAPANQSILAGAPLRFIRSCSAALPPQVMAEMERTFGVPVIEAYGMTEASHQMACNPLPPLVRKPGSVGIATGLELAIMAQGANDLLPDGRVGEIVIRGSSVMRGYVNNPEANATSFVDGWFRTGDQGYLDSDGYLFVTGRLKEIINRGGEKISPREVDEVLLDHPGVAQAVTFAMPDGMLGEEVAAAVVLHDPTVTEDALRRYAAVRLAPFKVPRRVVVVDEIPNGPTGKPQRIGLAERLGLSAGQPIPQPQAREFAPPATEMQQLLAEMWCELLGLPAVSIDDSFLDLGGDSVSATRLVARVRQVLDLELTLLDLFDAPTVAQQAVLLEQWMSREFDAETEPETHPPDGSRSEQ